MLVLYDNSMQITFNQKFIMNWWDALALSPDLNRSLGDLGLGRPGDKARMNKKLAMAYRTVVSHLKLFRSNEPITFISSSFQKCCQSQTVYYKPMMEHCSHAHTYRHTKQDLYNYKPAVHMRVCGNYPSQSVEEPWLPTVFIRCTY